MRSSSPRRRARNVVVLAAGLLATMLLVASPAYATTIYVSPTGTADADCSRCSPCDLATGATNAQAGDTVVLLDGTYAGQPLIPVNSGTSSAWITFQADTGAVPILDGGGGAVKATGIGSDTSVYVRFVGIVARNWASGFSNQWTGSTTEFTANGNWQYINCIGDGNTRNGFAFNSTKGVLIRECISAHNGTSTTSSWSSGFQLYAVQGTATDNVVERNVAFENMDAQKHTDGSGFIVDTMVTGVAFINNLAFLNGGSGIRLTKSAGISIINNTFYHNGRDTADTGPTNPGELYFTDGSQTKGLTFINNVGVATGSTQDPSAAWVFNGGTLTIPASNKTSGTFAAPDGTNPDFHLTSGNALIDKGDSANAPSADNGFDPKCIKKGKPTDIAVPSWSNYSVDYTYIKSIGGVARCWNPGKRPAGSGIDIGAYEYASTPVTGAAGSGGSSGAAGSSCSGGSTGSGGGSGSGGASATGTGGRGGAAGTAATGTAGSGGVTGAAGRGGTTGAAGSGTGVGGVTGGAGVTGSGVAGTTGAGAGSGSAGVTGSGGITTATGAAGTSGSAGSTGNTGPSENGPAGCGCALGDGGSGGLTGVMLAVVGLMVSRRRRPSGRRTSAGGALTRG